VTLSLGHQTPPNAKQLISLIFYLSLSLSLSLSLLFIIIIKEGESRPNIQKTQSQRKRKNAHRVQALDAREWGQESDKGAM
jgi:hypothetical protein